MKPLRIAIQKTGRLAEKSIELLKRCGLDFESNKGTLLSPCSNFPLEICFLRDDDIPEYVQEGITDLGICGENIIAEQNVRVNRLLSLEYGKCRLVVGVPSADPAQSIQDLEGRTVATTYPNLTSEYFDYKGVRAVMIPVNGSVEVAPSLGLSRAVCDLVSTGSTMKSNGLRPIETILESEAKLIASVQINTDRRVDELLLRIQSVLRALGHKYVVLNAERSRLDPILNLLPGIKSPSIVPLADEGWVAVHTVISEADFWEKITCLKNAGAQGIVVMNMEKVIV